MKIYKGYGTWTRNLGGRLYHLTLSCGSYREILRAYSILKRAGLDVAINKHEDHPSEAYDLYVLTSQFEKYKEELHKGMWEGVRL